MSENRHDPNTVKINVMGAPYRKTGQSKLLDKKVIIVLTNKWTENRSVYPELFDTEELGMNKVKGIYSPKNWTYEICNCYLKQ